ncbi:hypothetical protein ABZ330_05040 [Streptomyces sp. NPDC006172]|uniref:hypothetical protein n=1 Tax=Streptomyces sp. NPDC006172 TaxID=3154470 RepID=UPI0033FE004A
MNGPNYRPARPRNSTDKTFRLSENQVRRGHLLSRPAAEDWHLADAAADLGIDEAQLGLRLESAGFGFLLRQDVLDAYRKQERTRLHC